MRTEVANYIRGSGLSLRLSPQDSKTTGAGISLGWRRRSDLFITSKASVYSKRQTQRLTEEVTAANAALIDESVTTDIHRVFRMPGTLHGNSGLLKMRVKEIDSFDPQKDPVVLSGEKVKVHVDFSPGFSLNGINFGPYDSSTVEIPIYAAVFLAARGLGQVLAG